MPAIAPWPPVSWRRRHLSVFFACNARLLQIKVSEVAKRALDIVLALLLLIVFCPVFLAVYLASDGIVGSRRIGRGGQYFELLSFCFSANGSESWCNSVLSSLPVLINILRGDMSFVGPRPFKLAEVGTSDRFAWRRFDVRPGLICLWWIRRRANIAYVTETQNDAEYVDGLSARSDLGIMLRSIPAGFFGEDLLPKPERIRILGIPVNNISLNAAVQQIIDFARTRPARQICFVNADCVNIAFRDAQYRTILQNADLLVADGIGMKLAGRLLKQPIQQNVNGTDLLPQLCDRLRTENYRVFLLGAKPGVAADVVAWINSTYPGVKICGYAHGYFSDNTEILSEIRAAKADILLVAMGAPQQEKWIAEFLPQTGCSVAMGVGGLFDFFAGRIPRAPIWVREMGMEWLFRFIQEPGRMWKRYFVGNILFLSRVLLARSEKHRFAA